MTSPIMKNLFSRPILQIEEVIRDSNDEKINSKICCYGMMVAGNQHSEDCNKCRYCYDE